MRTRADVDRMRGEVATARRVAVIGGGYIGLEAAAVLARMGKQVVVLEAQERVLARVAGEALSRFYEAEHRAHGVDVRLGVTVECIEERDGSVAGVRLAGGEIVPAEMVIVGIGIVAVVEPVLSAGAEGGNGVSVDAHGRTTLADVFAIGDCALHANAVAENLPIRLECVQNANDLATTVARAITGDPQPYVSVSCSGPTRTISGFRPWGFPLAMTRPWYAAIRRRVASRRLPEAGPRHSTRLRQCDQGLRAGQRLVEHAAMVATDRLANVDSALKDIIFGRS